MKKFNKQNMPPEYLYSVITNITPDVNGGEAVSMVVDYFNDGNDEDNIFSTIQLTLNSYCNSANFNFTFGIDSLKSAIDQIQSLAPPMKTRDFAKVIQHNIKNNSELKEELEIVSDYSYLAQLIYDTREAAGLSRKQLADKALVSEATIEEIEESNSEDIRFENIIKVARALNLNLFCRN